MTKRILDILAALAGIVVLSPLLMAVAALVKVESKGPIFYRGVRVGRYGELFRIYKFRTMVPNAESLGGHSTALQDPRLTRIGPTLRKYKLDELPQLFNIIAGHMSIVGPRPQVKTYTDLYTAEEKHILDVRPGLTDFASIEFIHLDAMLGNENVDEKYQREIEPRKNELRLKYVREQSLMTDFRILVRTVARMFAIRKLWNSAD